MSAEPLPHDALYERGAARVLDAAGEPVGAAFLVSDTLLCTCAHVVAEEDGGRPADPVTVDFPLLASAAEPGVRVEAVVSSWRPEDDIALLRMAGALPGTEPLPLSDEAAGTEWDGDVRAFGFPVGVPLGVNATGRLRGRQRADRLQLDLSVTEGARIDRGFSGAAVWDVQRQVVVGMLVTRGRGSIAGTAYLVTADRLLLDSTVLPCPFRGLDRFEVEHARYFHGREREIDDLVRAVDAQPLTLLVGPSGSGKSSLLRAGLLEALGRRGTPCALRTPPSFDTSSTREGREVSSTGGAAADMVAEAVTAAWQAAAPHREARAMRFETVRQACAGSPGSLHELRGLLREELGAAGAVLLVDQFEEYANVHPRAALEALRLLSGVATVPDPAQGRGLRVVLTARPATLEALTAADTAAAVGRAVMLLAPMTHAALTRAVEEPVRAVPGLRLERGLAGRLVEDSRHEPGCLPLLQFALTELWQRRSVHTLTHAAYAEMGGAGGALATYADEALEACLRRTGTTRKTAVRLFQRLSRPDVQGGFTPRTVQVRDLPSDQSELAEALVGSRLLVRGVTGHAGAPGGADTVQVVHEALLREWSRLRAWLLEGAEFRQWQERTARDAADWEARGRPAGLLPHGVRLAEGLGWLAQRPDDLTGIERAFLRAGRRRQRRGVRRLWAVTTLVTVLALVATTLAVGVERARRRDLRQLRVAASTELADLAADHSSSSPDSAFRYAAAAWSADHTDAARAALFEQYLRARDVDDAYAGLWPGSAEHTEMAADGGTVVVASHPEDEAALSLTAVSGYLHGSPRAVRLTGAPGGLRPGDFTGAVSDDGRRYALATARGEVVSWDLSTPRPQATRLSAALPDRGDIYESTVDFSEDGKRLLHFLSYSRPRPEDAGRLALARLWATADHRELALSQRTMTGPSPSSAWLVGAGDSIAVVTRRKTGTGKGTRWKRYLRLNDTATGDLRRTVFGPVEGSTLMPTDRGRGVWVTSQVGTRWYGLTPDADEPGVPEPDPSFLLGDLSGTYLYDESTANGAGGGGDYRRMTLLDPRGAARYWSVTLPGGGAAESAGVVGSGDGPRTVVTAKGDTLLLARATRLAAGPLTYEASTRSPRAASPDGTRSARLNGGTVEILGPGSRVSTTRLSAGTPRPEDADLRLLWVTREGGDALALWSPDFRNLLLIDVDDPRKRTTVTWKCGRTGRVEWDLPQDVVQSGDGDLVLLCQGDSLVRLDPRAAVQSGGPLLLERDPEVPGNFFRPGQLTVRPGHPHEVAVLIERWREAGRIEVWDVWRKDRTARLEGSPLKYGADRGLVFSPEGSRLAGLGQDDHARWWRVDEAREDGRTRALDGVTGLLGVTDDGTLVVNDINGTMLISPDSGDRIGRMQRVSSEQALPAVVRGETLRLLSDTMPIDLDLTPSHWQRELCATLSGPGSRAHRARPRIAMARETPACPD
ncbi:serine protease [Streptomyces sp. NPDC003717]|uniref:serine protease n=1 Tax=Streptomyces sp. NPDC003717 TaxID=3154276 RepID=UPI0033A1E33A